MKNYKMLSVVILLSLFIISGCAPKPAPTATPIPTITKTRTPRPTRTATKTPLPTATETPVPQPIVLTGEGDSVVDTDKWHGAAIMHVTYTGGSNFFVWSYDSDGNKADLLINIIGSYEGTLPLDIFDGEHTPRLEIQSSGKWKIEILPLTRIRQERIPGSFSGTGDDVIYIRGGVPDLLKIDATKAKGNVFVWSVDGGKVLVVNKIAPYSGTVSINKDTFVLIIQTEGAWSVEVTTR